MKKTNFWPTLASSLTLSTMIAASAGAQHGSQDSLNHLSNATSPSTKVQPQRRIIKSSRSQTLINSNGTYQVQIEGQKISRARPLNRFIHLRRGSLFDPLEKSHTNRLAAFSSDNRAKLPGLYVESISNNIGAYIVQFHTQSLPDYQKDITKAGGKISTAFPPNAVLVLIAPNQLSKLRQLNTVRAVVPFLPIHKLEEGLENRIAENNNEVKTYSILAVTKKHTNILVNFITSIGGSIKTKMSNDHFNKSSRISANLTPSQLSFVAKNPFTLFIDELGDPDGEDIDDVKARDGFNWLESAAGYTGKGVGIEVYDRGFQIDHQELVNTPNPILVRSPQAEGSGGADHGTDISGILFAQGVDPQYRGLLPDAARPIVFSRYSGFPGNNQPNESELRAHLQELVDPNGPYRAVVQTSSTDYSRTLNYTTWSAEYDEVLFDLDLLKTQSQSNAGDQQSRPAAWAKNIVAVGGIKTLSTVSRSDDGWNNGASIGPAADNRIKPDLSGQYDAFDMIADGSGSSYNSRNGTSFSTPAVAGAFGILYQMWADGVFDGGPGKQDAPEFRDVFDVRPHAATAKALMIHTAFQYSFNSGDSHNLSRVKQGWGFPDVKNLYQTAQNNNWKLPILVNEDDVLLPGTSNSYTLTVDGSQPLKATLVYKDPRGNPASSIARINDLSLKVTSPSGVIYWGNNGLRQGNWSTPGGTSNTIDTVENVFIQTPETGTWNIEVFGDDIVQDGHVQTTQLDADYALVATGGVSSNTAPIADAGPDGNVQIPNAITLNGSVTDDNFPGTNLTNSWSQVSGPGTTTFADANSVTTTATFSTDGTYVLRLTAFDGEFTATDETTITVTPPPQNQTPVADAGPNLSIELPASAVLNGSCSDDGLPVGANVAENWSGPSGVTFANTNSATTTANFSAPGSYTLTLSCNDTELTGNDSTLVTVIAEQQNIAPTVNAGTDTDALVGTSIALNGTASDDGRPQGGSLTTTWAAVSGPGNVTFSDASSLTSNVTFSVEGNYVISLTANDGDLSTTDNLNVTVSASPVELISDNFETDLGSWSNNTSGDDYDWRRDSGGTPSSNTGPDNGSNNSTWYLYLETSNGSGAYRDGDTAILESGNIIGTHRSFSFDYHMYGSNMGTLNVDVSVAGGNWSNVWALSGQQHGSHSSNYDTATIDLSNYDGVLKLRFRAVAAGGYRGDMAIDNLRVSGIHAQVAPTFNSNPFAKPGATQNQSYSDSIANDAGDANGDPMSFSKISGPAWLNVAANGVLSGTPTSSDVGINSFVVEVSDGGLSSQATMTINVSDGSTPVVLSTSDFESDLGDWNNSPTGDDYDWTRDSNGTPSSNTGPSSGAGNSDYYLYFETSDGGRGAFNAGETAYIESIDITGSNRSMSFDYHMYGSEIGTLSVDVFVNGVWVNDVWTLSSQQHNSAGANYTNATVDLSSYNGTIKIRIWATAVGGWHGDIAIDNIVITGVN
ncbi:PKD domain-containing protein [Aliikangiella coralliicola]|uniref:MAM domain-containing protein n=1 Tax=Aliikangiella coralliicola TaxID=2592383 RepID=A0A545U662_9GAMM|nr:putative Ig domain-containing protein [Aliikangiella coralliicola]TQV84957.1 hypothetical protein FLL46_21430 [Aliikangiella coralliicola]